MKKILVIGSINYDIDMMVDKLPRKGSNVLANKVEYILGGKGSNAALACLKLGLDVSLYAKVGDDRQGEFLLDNLKKHGISTENLIVTDKSTTGKAFICIDKEGNNFIVVEKGANFSYDIEDENRIETLIQDYDLILIQLEINLNMIEKIIRLAEKYKKKLVIDAGPIIDVDYRIFKGAYIVSPNETELENLVGRKLSNFDDIKEASLELVNNGIEHVIVKLGSKGSYYRSKDTEYYQKAYKVKSVDTTAAGDSFMAGLCMGLLDDKEIVKALDIGSMCGAIATTRFGASSSLPTKEDLEEFRRSYEES